MARIGIVGCGFVGSAVKNAFDNPGNRLFIVDPAKEGSISLAEMMVANPEFIFVCVPTPIKNVYKIGEKNDVTVGGVDTSYVSNVLHELSKLVSEKRNPIVIVKSTITPDYWNTIPKNLDVVYNPELLRQDSADEDFLFPPVVVLGGEKNWCMLVEHLYKNHSAVHALTPYIHTSRENASMFKYAINCWLATKVVFFNQLFELFVTLGIHQEWETLTTMLSADLRIGDSHMQVPGPDGMFGFGGACFPKDTRAFLHFANMCGVDLSVLKEAVKANEEIRREY